MTQLFVALIMYTIHRYVPNPSYTVPDTGLKYYQPLYHQTTQLIVALMMYSTSIHRYVPNLSYTVPVTGLALSTIILSDDTVVCSPDNVYYAQIHT